MQQPRRLGRGLNSLLETAEADQTQTFDKTITVMEIPIEKVFPNPDQPRKEFDDTALADLSASIQEKGVIQPILVLERADNTYMIIAGERRYRASKLAGRTTIPALVKAYTVEETMEVALIENLQREDLNPLEEALAFRGLIDRFNLSQEEIAHKIGKNRTTVANSLRLLKLPEVIQHGIASNAISAGHARALLAIKADDTARTALFAAIVEQGLSVRDAEWIAQVVNNGPSFSEAILQRLHKDVTVTTATPVMSEASVEAPSEPDIMAMSRGATIKVNSANQSTDGTMSDQRAPELGDMEQELIVALGTKVQIKGDIKTGRVEITYFSADDLEKIYDRIVGKN